MEKINLNSDQQKIFDEIINSYGSFFITGGAGTGKSVLLKELVYFFENQNKNVAVVAPTGIASLNVDGSTIHSFFHLDPHDLDSSTLIKSYADKIKVLDVLIIDEISMVRCDLFDKINDICQNVKENKNFFGGIKIIIFGDMYQLAPITDNDVEKVGKMQLDKLKIDYGIKENNEYFFFYSRAFIEFKSRLSFRELKINERQKNDSSGYLKLLHKMRTGNELLNEDFNVLSKCVLPEVPEDSISITATRIKSYNINKDKLNKIDGDIIYSRGIVHDRTLFEDIRDNLPEQSLEFKVGARVIMSVNDINKRYVNGTFGKITNIEYDLDFQPLLVDIEINKKGSREIIKVSKYVWSIKNYFIEKEKLNSKYVKVYEQFPFRLGWSITIHKSQGQTYEDVYVSIGDGWLQHGLYYVALSRCKTLDGLKIDTRISKANICHSIAVDDFMQTYFNYTDKKLNFDEAKLKDEYYIFEIRDDLGIESYKVFYQNEFIGYAHKEEYKGRKKIYFFDKEKNQIDINYFNPTNLHVSYKELDYLCKAEIINLDIINFKIPLQEEEYLNDKIVKISIYNR